MTSQPSNQSHHVLLRIHDLLLTRSTMWIIQDPEALKIFPRKHALGFKRVIIALPCKNSKPLIFEIIISFQLSKVIDGWSRGPPVYLLIIISWDINILNHTYSTVSRRSKRTLGSHRGYLFNICVLCFLY